MRFTFKCLLAVVCAAFSIKGNAQTLPGDSISFGPMLSPIYHDSVRVWVLTKNATGSGKVLSIELSSGTGNALVGTVHDSDSRGGYHLRSYSYGGLVPGLTYTATIKSNGVATARKAVIAHKENEITDFEFLAGGCGRIMDTTRCVDRFEGLTHINGTTDIFKRMAGESSDLMVWLGDAVYLFGIEHSGGTCPGMVNDWDNRDALFSRYYFNRQFHDTLLRNMPQLAITDNHDVGGNEFNKYMPTLGISKDNFMKWLQNPTYTSNNSGQGLYSSYKYKDVEFFLLDNRSYRESTTRHLGPEQLAWLKQALLNSTAPFKVLISGTPSFAKYHGGRNFAITTECDTLVQFIKANNINGVMSYSADIHNQEFYGRYNDHTYPFFDIVSGNLASDIGTANPSINPDSDVMFFSNLQTYARTNVYGEVGNRRYKVDYVSPLGVTYYGVTIHEDMLKSIDDSTKKIGLAFSNSLYDSSKYHRAVTAANTVFGVNRTGVASSALEFAATSSLSIPFSPELGMEDRTYSISFWMKPTSFPTAGYAALFSNSNGNNGFTLGLDNVGHPVYINHFTNVTTTAYITVASNKWSQVIWQYDNVKLQLMLYLNGQLVQKWSNIPAPTKATTQLYIGNNYNNRHFVGSMDEFNIYGKLITPRSIAALSGYVTHRGNELALTGSQNIFIPSTEINPVFAGNFTMECWARFTGSVAGPLVSTHGRINNQTTGWDIEFSNNKANLVFGNNSTSGWLKITEAGNAWQVGEWNHIAAKAVPGDSIYLYINGNKVGTAKYTSYYANTFGFGLAKSSFYNSTAGVEMDELRIWDAALPQDSIRKRMHYQLAGNEDHLAFYYNFSAFTDTTILAAGSHPYNLTLEGATLNASTAPVAAVSVPYQGMVDGNWSIRKATTAGLSFDDAIPSFISNLVAGKSKDTTLARTATGSQIYYLKGGWQLDALNMPLGTISINLAQSLPKYDSISKLASEYYLLKQETPTSFSIINTGYYNGSPIGFGNTFIDTGVYYLGWKSDSSIASNSAFVFNGSTDIVRVANAQFGNPAGDFSIEAWAKINAGGTLEDDIVSTHENPGQRRGYFIEYAHAGGNTPGIRGGIAGSGGAFVNAQFNTTWLPGQWHHVVMTYSAISKVINLYQDGTLVATTAMGSQTPVFSTRPFAIGGSDNYANNDWNGAIDELRFWNRELSSIEVDSTAHLRGGSTNNLLKAYYNFDQLGTANTVTDGSGNGLHATAVTGMTNANIIPSFAPIKNVPYVGLVRYKANWAGKNSSSNSGLDITTTYTTEPIYVLNGRSEGTGVTTAGVSGLVTKRLQRVWHLQKTGSAAASYILNFPFAANNLTIGTAGKMYLMKSPDGIAFTPALTDTGVVTSSAVAFTLADTLSGYITLGFDGNFSLPLHFLGLSATVQNNKKIVLGWSFNTTMNTATFEVERLSQNGVFEKIATLTKNVVAGNNTKNEYIDAQPLMGTNQYRIKHTDVDGKISYTKVASALIAPSSTIRIFPNPINDKLNVESYQVKSTQVLFSILDDKGAIVYKRAQALNAGYNTITIPTIKMSSGHYTLVAEGSNIKTTLSFIKQ